ncbi:MAG: ASCH domain-containing protein [Arcanobacterium sp.]|nr:ASCH domain-containing protein [Arcanobacterium sp.]
MTEEIIETPTELIAAFWTHAINAAGLNPAEAYVGQDGGLSVLPPAFTFGINREQADELAQLVVSGKKTATSSLLKLYETAGEAIPQLGDMAIVCSGSGVPVALISNKEVRVLPFDAVGEDVALAEGEGDLSLEYWREVHREFFSAEAQTEGVDFSETDEVVVEIFEVIHAAQ